MRVLKITLYGLASLILVVIMIGFMLPEKWSFSVSVAMQASPERIYPYIANLKKWQEWSPWTTQSDPSLNYIYSGPDAGIGAQEQWTSQSMGTGSLQITAAEPHSGVAYVLKIQMHDFQDVIQGRIETKASDGQTVVTWFDSGNSGKNILRKWMTLLMKPRMTAQFHQGLVRLKSLVEADDRQVESLAHP